jgi:hypothetical protein
VKQRARRYLPEALPAGIVDWRHYYTADEKRLLAEAVKPKPSKPTFEQRISELCRLTGQPGRSARFIDAGISLPAVRTVLMGLRKRIPGPRLVEPLSRQGFGPSG